MFHRASVLVVTVHRLILVLQVQNFSFGPFLLLCNALAQGTLYRLPAWVRESRHFWAVTLNMPSRDSLRSSGLGVVFWPSVCYFTPTLGWLLQKKSNPFVGTSLNGGKGAWASVPFLGIVAVGGVQPWTRYLVNIKTQLRCACRFQKYTFNFETESCDPCGP